MPAVAKISDSQIETGSVAAISTNARIDYILRFSKQAVLVVDELSANYSHIGNLFVGSLPDDHNAAYISVSAKLDDIQIRCRLIEQLFSDVLFDPEQSLAVSILRLAKGSSQPISIVIDHAQFLSFKLIHELCYLAEISKKAKLNINIVMLGNKQAGAKISTEKGLFARRLAIVEVETGQLLNLDNRMFKLVSDNFFRKHTIKIIVVLMLMFTFTAIAIFFLQPRDLFSYSALPPSTKSEPNQKQKFIGNTKTNNKPVKTVSEQIDVGVEDIIKKVISTNKQASVSDIFSALNNAKIKEIDTPKVIATPKDILMAIEAFSDNALGDKTNLKDETKNMPLNDALNTSKTIATTTNKSAEDNNYYLNFESGYVIQLAGFTDPLEFNPLKEEFSVIRYVTYQRLLNDKNYFVVTSLRYPTKALALAAINKLPAILQRREPWVKSIAAVKSEILAYQSVIKS